MLVLAFTIAGVFAMVAVGLRDLGGAGAGGGFGGGAGGGDVAPERG